MLGYGGRLFVGLKQIFAARGNDAYAPTKGVIDAIRMTDLCLFTVGSLKPFKGFNEI